MISVLPSGGEGNVAISSLLSFLCSCIELGERPELALSQPLPIPSRTLRSSSSGEQGQGGKKERGQEPLYKRAPTRSSQLTASAFLAHLDRRYFLHSRHPIFLFLEHMWEFFGVLPLYNVTVFCGDQASSSSFPPTTPSKCHLLSPSRHLSNSLLSVLR